jgi:dUTP pyrophosphatase
MNNKFKIGDTVKITNNYSPLRQYDKYIGSSKRVIDVSYTSGTYWYQLQDILLDNSYNNIEWEEGELELAIPNQRGFEVISTFTDIVIPKRATSNSAGYDICACGETVVKPMERKLIATGLKAYMQPDEYLGLHIRSSLAFKKGLTLINSQGIVDADYYNNSDNEGHIMFAMINLSNEDVVIKHGERIGQGIFYKYLKVDDDNTESERNGGFGSTT